MQEEEVSDEDTTLALKDKSRDIHNYLEIKKKGIIKQHLVKNINKKLEMEKLFK